MDEQVGTAAAPKQQPLHLASRNLPYRQGATGSQASQARTRWCCRRASPPDPRVKVTAKVSPTVSPVRYPRTTPQAQSADRPCGLAVDQSLEALGAPGSLHLP